MTGWIMAYLRLMLTIGLAVGMLFYADSCSVTPDFTELTQIIAEHHAEIEEHGQSHEITDHDHNIAFLPQPDPSGSIMLTSTSWVMANSAMADRRDYGLDRPPRV